MAQDAGRKPNPLNSKTTRRALLGGALAAGGGAVAYAALGGSIGPLDLRGGDAAAQASEARALEKESVRISHLLRRAGFGATRAEYDRYVSIGLEATTAELLNYGTVDDSAAEKAVAAVPVTETNRSAPVARWLTRMATTKRPLQEKMTLFWHSLLTSQLTDVRDPQAMVRQNEFFRTHAFDTFPNILRGITMDPAMMVYLDMAGSVRRSPNENFARELMELFALGEGNYTETDVREAARAFTGWNLPRRQLAPGTIELQEPIFRPANFDNGTKTVLGKTGNLRPEDVVDAVVAQPAAGRYITRRLFSYFVYPDPTDEDIAPFVEIYEKNEKRIGAVVEAMLRSDVFYSAKAYRSIVKSPVEYVVGTVKALGAEATVTQVLEGGRGDTGYLSSMGQLPMEPPNVAGWPGNEMWLNSTTMFVRLNYLNAVTGGAPILATPRRNQRPQTPPAPPSNLGTAAQAIENYLPLVLDDNVPDASRLVFLDYAGGPDVALKPHQLRGLVYLMLASPQYHLS